MPPEPPRPRIGQFVKLRAFMASHLGRDPRTITRCELDAKWQELLKHQEQHPRHRFLSTGRVRKICPELYRKSCPDLISDPMSDARRLLAVEAAAGETLSGILARLDKVEARAARNTTLSRRNARRVRQMLKSQDSPQPVSAMVSRR